MILKVKNLSVDFQFDSQAVSALRDICFQVAEGESVGLVGESGSGKSLLSLAIMGLLPSNAKISKGEILFENSNLLCLSPERLREIRGDRLSMIFQDPMSALNPVLNLEKQMGLLLRAHEGSLSAGQIRDRSIELFRLVGLPDPVLRLRSFPHEMSGGQAQRVMIAMAMACHPKLLIADEPTTALDVTIQAQVMSLLRRLQTEKKLAMIVISHDLALVSQNTQRIYVLYGGEIVETGSTKQITETPKHPYTQALLSCLPARQKEDEKMITIQGQVPSLRNRPKGCQFQTRCPHKQVRCEVERPEMNDSSVRCFYPESYHYSTGP
jgi:oligopeptide/dipeptide ABC transporter ATP-binding protein